MKGEEGQMIGDELLGRVAHVHWIPVGELVAHVLQALFG